jgi:YVTN family beta-propeller protein
MDTLAYLHLAVAYEASAKPEPGTTPCDGLFFEELNHTRLSGVSISLILLAIAVTSLSFASPSLALEKGNRGSQVTSLQKKLQAAGYFGGPVTGYYGSLTQAAVMKFQKANGLKPDGIVDAQTLKVLQSSSGAPAPAKKAAPPPVSTDNRSQVTSSSQLLQRGNRSSQVTSLQKKLQAAGYFGGPVTGYYGSLTQEAVMKFQKANGLYPNGIADAVTLKALASRSGASTPAKKATPQKAIADDSKVENQGNLDTPQKTAPSSQTQPQKTAPISQPQPKKTAPSSQTQPQKTAPISQPQPKKTAPSSQAQPQKTTPSPQTQPEKTAPTPLNKPQATDPSSQTQPEKTTPSPQTQPKKTDPSSQTRMKLKKTIYGKISPKSVVHSGSGLFFAQNMMYSHTITVYDREHKLVKTIPDSVNLPKYGYSKFKGNYKGAPVEASFSEDGKYAWVSNYQMYGSGFNNPGSDVCSPSQKTDKSFLYRINTETLNVEKVIQVGSVPKFVATSPDNSLVLVSNWCSWDLSVVDTEQNKEIKRIKLGPYPRGIVVDGDSEKAYVAVMGSSDIARIDLDDFSVGWLKNIGNAPRHLNLDPAGKYIYSTLNGEGRVAKIDLSTGKVLKKVTTGNAPRSMVISDDGQRLYVVNYNSNTVSKVRTSDMKVLQTVNVNASPIGITYDPETREVWVACYSGSIMVFQD